MIEFEEAFKTVKHATNTLDTEHVDLTGALHRVLADNIHSPREMPPFNKSAMDGYACRESDLSNPLEVIEIIPAGSTPTKIIGPNQCAKIMTGAMVPSGADCVIMIEHTKELAPNQIQFTRKSTSSNICLKGEDIKKGQVVLKKHTRLKPQHIAILASVGCHKPLVFKKPRVALLATGSELVEPWEQPGISQIVNSNGWQLIAQLQKIGIQANYYGIAKDSKEQTQQQMEKCLKENDVLLITGGVSVGDYDFVPTILKDMGFNTWFRKISVKPGKHTIFSTCQGKYVLGLPGNPVSTFVQFEILVKPMLFQMMGYDYNHPVVRLPLAQDFKRKRTERLEFIPVRFNANNQVVPIPYHGSAHIHAYQQATAIMAIPLGVKNIKEGELVHVRQI